LYPIPRFFQTKNIPWGDPNNVISLIIFGITAVLGFTYAILLSISWFMPEWMKKHFNKDFQRVMDKDYSEDELLNMIKNELKKPKA
jgi:hypothetical protein